MRARRLGAAIAGSVLVAAACGAADDGGASDVVIEAPADDASSAAAEPDRVPGTGVTITPGRANWSTGYFQVAVYAALLEELGYTVTDPAANEYPPSEAYSAMAEGAFDFWPNGWYPQHQIWHQEELADGSLVGEHVQVIGNELLGAGLQGLIITKSVADEHGITSLDQINSDPDLVALFDSDGNGLGNVFGCPEDWTCDNVIDEMIEFNGWTNLEQTKAGYDGLVADATDRVLAGEPVIQYTWSPSGYLATMRPGDNVLWLSMGGSEHVLDGSTESGLDYARVGAADLGDTCTAESCWPGWEVEDIQVTANRRFAEANPVVVALFEVVEIPVGAIADQMSRYDAGADSEADVEQEASDWISANRDRVDRWIAHAIAAG